MSVDTLPCFRHTDDPMYQEWRRDEIKKFASWKDKDIEARLSYEMRATPPRDDHEINVKRVGQLLDYVALGGSPQLQKDILGTTTTTGLVSGSAMIRQDLEPVGA